MLRGLRNYEFFDADAFFADKRLMTTNLIPWIHFETKELLGTKVEAVIIEDKTDYGDTDFTNLFEKVVFKTNQKNLSIPIKSEIKCTNIVGVLYGEYRNQLSLRCDDIEVVAKNTK